MVIRVHGVSSLKTINSSFVLNSWTLSVDLWKSDLRRDEMRNPLPGSSRVVFPPNSKVLDERCGLWVDIILELRVSWWDCMEYGLSHCSFIPTYSGSRSRPGLYALDFLNF